MIRYQSVGSGAGIKQIKSKTVDFGASDAPLIPKELAASGLVQFPIVMGGVAPVLNIKGVGPGQLKLTGPVLADIFLGKITRWDDPDGRPGILTGNRPKRIQERLEDFGMQQDLGMGHAGLALAHRTKINSRDVFWLVHVPAKNGIFLYAPLRRRAIDPHQHILRCTS